MHYHYWMFTYLFRSAWHRQVDQFGVDTNAELAQLMARAVMQIVAVGLRNPDMAAKPDQTNQHRVNRRATVQAGRRSMDLSAPAWNPPYVDPYNSR